MATGQAQNRHVDLFPVSCLHSCHNLLIFIIIFTIDKAASEPDEPPSKDVESILRTEDHARSTNFPVRFYWIVCAREMHSTTEIRNDVSEQVCVKNFTKDTMQTIVLYL